MDSVLKRNVVNLALQDGFVQEQYITENDDGRNYRITDETGLNMTNMPKRFEEAWKVWKEQGLDELSYQTLKSLVIKGD